MRGGRSNAYRFRANDALGVAHDVPNGFAVAFDGARQGRGGTAGRDAVANDLGYADAGLDDATLSSTVNRCLDVSISCG
jgi:hypothetical protein